MGDLGIALGSALVGALCAFFIPKLYAGLVRRRLGPLVSSVAVDGFDPFVSPQVFLIPPDAGPPEDYDVSDRHPYGAWKGDKVPLGWQTVRVTLRGRSAQPAIITKVVPRILERRPPLPGWFIAPELGGGTSIKLVIIDLDQAAPGALLMELGSDSPDDVTLENRFSFQVTDTDVEQLEITAFTTSNFVRWGVDLVVEDGGEPSVVEIRDDRMRISAVDSSLQRCVTDARDDSFWEDAEWGYQFGDNNAEYHRGLQRSSRS